MLRQKWDQKSKWREFIKIMSSLFAGSSHVNQYKIFEAWT